MAAAARRERRLVTAPFALSNTTLLSAFLASACSAPPQPPPAPKPVAKVEAPPPAPPLPPARWVASQPGPAFNLTLGPWSSAGRLALFRGRRMIVDDSGATRIETTPALKPLAQLLYVPTPSGPRLVGRGEDSLVLLDDPLGDGGAVLASGLKCDSRFRLGALPGAVAVWCKGSAPRIFDIETGAERPPSPDFPLLDAAFLNEKEGTAIFAMRGLVVTRNGGASWQAPKTQGGPEDLLWARELHIDRENKLWAGYVSTLEGLPSKFARIDVTAGALEGPAPSAPFVQSDGKIVESFNKWTSLLSDPLAAAAARGIAAPSGGAYVVAKDQVVRVDLETGDASLVTTLNVPVKDLAYSQIARVGSDVWVLSSSSPSSPSKQASVVRGTLEGDRLEFDNPMIIDFRAHDLRVSPSGGVMVLGDEAAKDESASVRQLDGSWKSFRPSAPIPIRGAGPLADGRFAFVMGLDEKADPNVASGKQSAGKKGPRIAIVSPSGAVEEGPIFDMPSSGPFHLDSPIEEDERRALHFVLRDSQGPLVIEQPKGTANPRVTRIPGATSARLAFGRGIAVGPQKIFLSLDSGTTWSEEPAPPRLIDEQRAGGPAVLQVSEIGSSVGRMLRIGWGKAALPGGGARPAAATITLASEPSRPVAGKRHILSCRGAGGSSSKAVFAGGDENLFGPQKESTETFLRNYVMLGDPYGYVLDTAGQWVQEGKVPNEDQPSGPTTWTLRWIDPTEIGSRVRSWRGVPRIPHKGRLSHWDTMAGPISARADRAFFRFNFVEPDDEDEPWTAMFLRLRGGGGLTFAKVPSLETDIQPNTVVFGTGPKAPIAWLQYPELYIWREGEAPRLIARMPDAPGFYLDTVWLGEPTDKDIPMLVADEEWTTMRAVPIPAAGKEATLLASDGWASPAPPLVPERLPACGAGAKGPLFLLKKVEQGGVILDAAKSDAPMGTYGVRISGGAACVASVAVTFESHEEEREGWFFVRADLSGKRAEGGEMAGSKVQNLACSWIERTE